MAEKEQDIGALWQKQSAKGPYLSGSITLAGAKYEIVCFLNNFKKEAKHPDYRIFLSQPREQSSYGPRDNGPALNNLDTTPSRVLRPGYMKQAEPVEDILSIEYP
jgi:uncharacterized protein (DUF736 family)